MAGSCIAASCCRNGYRCCCPSHEFDGYDEWREIRCFSKSDCDFQLESGHSTDILVHVGDIAWGDSEAEEGTKSEDSPEETFVPEKDWPSTATIKFKNVSASYRYISTPHIASFS